MTHPVDTAATCTTEPQIGLAERPARWRIVAPLLRREWLFSLALAAVLCLQLYFSIGRLSQTADETTHLYSGYRILACGDYSFSPEHPPVGKVLAALPLLMARVPVNCSPPKGNEAYVSLDWLYAHQNWASLLHWSRVAASIQTIALLLLVWFTARLWFGSVAGALAALLFAFEPNILAHGALVTTDIAVAFWMFAAVAAFYVWATRRSTVSLLVCGLTSGLTLCAKHSGVMVFPILFALAILHPLVESMPWRLRVRGAGRNLLALAAIAALAIATVWAAYGFRYTARPDGVALQEVQRFRGDGTFILADIRDHHLLPEAYIEGFHRARMLARGQSAPVMLLGRMYYNGAPRHFFPVVILVKSTLGALLLALATLIVVPALVRRYGHRLLYVVVPPLIFLAACMSARMSSGVRHTMPMAAFALVLVAAGAVALWRWRPMRWLVAAAFVLHIASSLHAYPNYLSYANEAAGGPSRLHRRLPNTDWGHSYLELKEYLAKNFPNQPCWLASVYLIDVRNYGVPCQQFWSRNFEPVPRHVRGVIVLDSGIYSERKVSWSPSVESLRPVALIGGSSMAVFAGEFDMTEAAGASSAFAAIHALGQSQPSKALAYATSGVEAIPDSAYVRFAYCRALVANERFAEAQLQCSLARVLIIEEALTAQEERAVRLSVEAQQKLEERQTALALEAAERAVLTSPESVTARLTYCRVMGAAAGDIAAAQTCHSADLLRRARWGNSYPRGDAFSERSQIDAIMLALGLE